jgi:hypothetical protein
MVDSVLAPLRRLVNDGLFWQYQSDGLALYSRPGWWRALRVPLDLPELAVMADRFHISPLLPLLTGDGHFFVLLRYFRKFNRALPEGGSAAAVMRYPVRVPRTGSAAPER